MSALDNVTLKPELRIIAVLSYLSNKYGRSWSYPSQDTILELLKRFHALTLSRRSLNRNLAGLEALGYIKRTRRHTKDRHGALILKSTVYTLLRPAFEFARTLGETIAKLSTILVHNFKVFAVPKPAQYARHHYLIMNNARRIARTKLRW